MIVGFSRVFGGLVLLPLTTAYTNFSGQGDRESFITVTENITEGSGTSGDVGNLVNGATGLNGTASYGVGTGVTVQAGDYFRFQWPWRMYIDEATFEHQGTPNHGTWKWQGSHNGVDWVDVSDPFSWTTPQFQVMTLNPKPEGYEYYQMICVTPNSTYATIWYEEMTFKIAAGAVFGNDSDTVLLLDFEGADGSTTFTDNSVGGSHGNATVVGDAHVEYDQGGGSGSTLYCTQSGGGQVYYPSSSDWNLGPAGGGNDFTIDFRFRIDAENTGAAQTGLMTTNNGANGWTISCNIGASVTLRIGASNNGISHAFALDTWYHLAIIREGTTITCAVDGVNIGTFPDVDMNNDGEDLRLNSFTSAGNFPSDLYLDRVRVTKGLARWTSFPFTPPEGSYSSV